MGIAQGDFFCLAAVKFWNGLGFQKENLFCKGGKFCTVLTATAIRFCEE